MKTTVETRKLDYFKATFNEYEQETLEYAANLINELCENIDLISEDAFAVECKDLTRDNLLSAFATLNDLNYLIKYNDGEVQFIVD